MRAKTIAPEVLGDDPAAAQAVLRTLVTRPDLRALLVRHAPRTLADAERAIGITPEAPSEEAARLGVLATRVPWGLDVRSNRQLQALAVAYRQRVARIVLEGRAQIMAHRLQAAARDYLESIVRLRRLRPFTGFAMPSVQTAIEAWALEVLVVAGLTPTLAAVLLKEVRSQVGWTITAAPAAGARA